MTALPGRSIPAAAASYHIKDESSSHTVCILFISSTENMIGALDAARAERRRHRPIPGPSGAAVVVVSCW